MLFSWEKISCPVEDMITVLEICPNDSKTFFAGTYSGLYISRDKGLSWSKSSQGMKTAIRGEGIIALCIHPKHTESMIVIACEPSLQEYIGDWYYRSQDMGGELGRDRYEMEQ